MKLKKAKRLTAAKHGSIVIHSLRERAKYAASLSLRATVLLSVPRGPKSICFMRTLARDGVMTDILYIDGNSEVIEAASRARFVWIEGLGIRLKARVLGHTIINDDSVLQIAAFPYLDALAKRMHRRQSGSLG